MSLTGACRMMLASVLDIGMESGPECRARGSTSRPSDGRVRLSFDARIGILAELGSTPLELANTSSVVVREQRQSC